MASENQKKSDTIKFIGKKSSCEIEYTKEKLFLECKNYIFIFFRIRKNRIFKD